MPKVVPPSGPAYYEPDYAPESYTPPTAIGTPWQTVAVFLPHGKPKPDAGFNPIFASGFGGFASTRPTTIIEEPGVGASDIQRILWGHLESGGSVVGFGLTGNDTDDYTPGGDKYGDPDFGGFMLPAHVPGQATYDQPGSGLADYDHWDDVGSSTDGGLSTPHQDFPVTSEEVHWCIQYGYARADAWGINMARACLMARSAGAAVCGQAVFGPDRADPEMKDHRANSTRVPLAFLGASSGWFPGFAADEVWSVPLPFPVDGDHEAVATQIDEAPSIWPREFSYLRAGTRDYSTLGPGITGAELRALNGSKLAVYLVNADASLGLVTKTPTQALAMVGTDAANNRVPALLDEIPSTQLHPAIMGPLAIARLREIEVAGHHAANSRLVMLDATLAQLVGHVDASGNPAEALVYATVESLAADSQTVADDFLAWLQEQWERLDVEESVEPPAPAALHPRQEILAAAREVLDGATSAGPRVWADRALDFEHDQLPAIAVQVGSELEPELLSAGPQPIYRRTVQLEVTAAVSALPSDAHPPGQVTGARLDALLLQIENALFADTTLGGEARDLELGETRRGFDAEGQQLIGGATIRFAVTYDEQYPRVQPEPLLQFQKARVVYDLAPQDSYVDAEDLVTPEQGGTGA